MAYSFYDTSFYCTECGKEFDTGIELYTHNCDRKKFKAKLREANTQTGCLFASSE